MTAANGHTPPQIQVIPLLVMIPVGASAPQFQVIGQWHTTTGIMCPARQVQAKAMGPAELIQMFIALVNTGTVGQIVKAEDGSDLVVDLPQMNLTMRPPPPPLESPEEGSTAEAPPPSRIILPGG